MHFQRLSNPCKRPENRLNLLDINSGVYVHGSTSSSDPVGPLAWSYLSKFNSAPAALTHTAVGLISVPLGVRRKHEGLKRPCTSGPVPSDSFLLLLLPYCPFLCRFFKAIPEHEPLLLYLPVSSPFSRKPPWCNGTSKVS